MSLLRNRATEQQSNDAAEQLRQFERAASDAAQTLFNSAGDMAATIAGQFGIAKTTALQSILTRLRDHDAGLFTDGRAAYWRARIRLYEVAQDNEVLADSDADCHPGESGKSVHMSLPAMVKWAVEFICANSSSLPMGLESGNLERRTRSFRTQMSNRRDGTGTMRIDYNVGGVDMMARIDVVREMGTAAYEAKSAADRLAEAVSRHQR